MGSAGGDDGTIWGGEFLSGDIGATNGWRARPVAMRGGTHAVREPWRNLYAQLIRDGLA